MKILYDYQIFYDQQYGGVSRYFVELYKILKNNNDIKICCPFSRNYYLKKQCGKKIIPDKILGSTFLRRVLNRFVFIKINRFACKRIARSKKTNVVHQTWNRPYLNSVCKSKLVVTIHDMIHEIYFSDVPGVAQEIENKKRAIYDSAAIITISENTKKDILRFYPDVDETKINVIYHGTNHLPKASKPKIEGFPEKYILYVGRRDSYKGFDFMVEALADYLHGSKDVVILAIGGPDFSQVELDKFKSLNIENKVLHFNMNDAELAYSYGHALCFVYPSKYEGFGFPLLEAFDNNCPVACTRSSSLPEVAGEAALYFDYGDKETLANDVSKIIGDNAFRDELIKKGRERVKIFSWEKCAKETEEVYRKVCS